MIAPSLLPSTGFPRFAHHPACPRHGHHLLWVRGRPLCLGCTCMAVGAAVGALTLASAQPLDVSLPVWAAAHAALVAPTTLQPWVQVKPYKIAARTALGAASATWCLGALGLGPAIGPRWVWVAACFGFFAIAVRALSTLRDRHTANPCHTCPLGAYPTCSWNLANLLAELPPDTPGIEALRALGAVESFRDIIEVQTPDA